MKAIKYDNYNLYFELGTYNYGGALFIGMITEDEESFCDLTINITDYMFELDNEVIINGDISEELIETLEDLGILIDTYKFAYSGFGKYKVMIFNEEIAKDYVKNDYREMI